MQRAEIVRREKWHV